MKRNLTLGYGGHYLRPNKLITWLQVAFGSNCNEVKFWELHAVTMNVPGGILAPMLSQILHSTNLSKIALFWLNLNWYIFYVSTSDNS